MVERQVVILVITVRLRAVGPPTIQGATTVKNLAVTAVSAGACLCVYLALAGGLLASMLLAERADLWEDR